MAGVGKRRLLREVNPHLICPLCRGYLIDATTVVECLHSFCRSCILKHLSKAAHCPSCKHALHKAKPNIKADKTLQDIVYKLVPGLYHKEMRKRREFYKKHPKHAESTTPEQRGEDVSGRLIFAPDDAVSLSLEYLPPDVDPLTILNIDTDTNHLNGTNNNTNNNHNNNGFANNRRYLQCPALVSIAHLKKFLALKYSIDVTRYNIEICHRRAALPDHWTLMDVAYSFAWKRIAPMRFFYLVGQEEQKLEAPVHQRPSTPGLGACLPPNDVVINSRDESNANDIIHKNSPRKQEISKLEVKLANNNETSMAKDTNKISDDKVSSPVDKKQMSTVNKNETKKTMMTPLSTAVAAATPIITTTTNATMMPTTTVTTTNTSASPVTCNDSNNKQIKSPIKIMKNSDGKYEVLKNSPPNWNGKEQTAATTVTDVKPTSPEFSVVSIGNGQNSNGVKITLKQCSPTQNSTNAKKPKVISNVLLRCGQVEKDSSGALVIQQLQKDKDIVSPSSSAQDKQQEKQRRKTVTFMDGPTSEKISPNSAQTMLKTALKKPAEQQDKKQFLQGFQLAARESIPEDITLKSSVRRDAGVGSEVNSLQKRENTSPKVAESSKKDAAISANEVKEKSNIENTGSNVNNNTATSAIANRLAGMVHRTFANKGSDDVDGRAFNSGTSSSTNASDSHSTAKMDVYTFQSSDPPVVPAGAVKRKCPPGVPIVELKRKRQQIQGAKKQTVSSSNSVKRTTSTERAVPANKTIGVSGDHHRGPNRMSNMSNGAKASTNPTLPNDTRKVLDGCGLSIPASLSITVMTSKQSGTSGQFAESNDFNDSRKTAALGKVNITLNDQSVDSRVLKALKIGQIRMPAPPKAKSPGTAITKQQTDRNEMNQQQRTTLNAKRKREQESILDLSGGKKTDIHPLRIPQPVTKHKTNNRASGGIPAISDQGQVVTLMGGHRYYRAPPGSLTPAVHRVNDCLPLPTPSRMPVYAPTLTDVSRTSANFSSVFPSLQSLYALSQAPNLQQFQMDARLRLPQPPPLRAAEGIAILGNSDNNANFNSISGGMPGKSHLAAQCAPVKPARSSIAPLAVPINKQQQSVDKSANISVNRAPSTNKSPFHNNESCLASAANETARLTVQTRYSSDIESVNRFLSSRSNANSTKNNEQTIVENSKSSNTESRNESIDTGNSMQQQQHHDTASPRVSSTASPSPPPGSVSAGVRNDDNTNHSGDSNVSNVSNGSNIAATSSSLANKNSVGAEVTPASPDSSSVVAESPTSKSCTISTDQETPTDGPTSDTTKRTDSTVSPDADGTVDGSVPSVDDKKKTVSQSDDVNQLTSEVHRKLLSVLPSTDWAKNPIAAQHLGNFLKSLNVMKSEEYVEESKMEKADHKTTNGNNDARIANDTPKSKDTVERS